MRIAAANCWLCGTCTLADIYGCVARCTALTSSQKGDLGLSDPSSGQGADGGARTRDRRFPVDLRADSLATVQPTSHLVLKEIVKEKE
ncbi:hypothetical protein PoB_005510300 [Plakobranchus ocellatus]|uniref:Uncharacterized protein n=1 Tax=Plakobranchus ocellatus TaxID=259542 RepID=A0AAV4C9P0_9GAST|nr:hypothetical protein PoB_005510300 [Plakobranchus ocellatus]